MTVRYIGSKARLAESILDIVGNPTSTSTNFIDAFCGTGIIARTAGLRGWNVSGNDTLLSSTYLAEASLYSIDELDFSRIGSYTKAVDFLNKLTGEKGFIWKSYSPASKRFTEYERRYFSEENAMKIDAIREQIAKWHEEELIGYREQVLLIADLIEASNNVANIAGTYGCFLKKWTPQSKGSIEIKERDLFPCQIKHRMTVGDVFNVTSKASDVVYLDPPYTKRQYASYYHIPETIAYHDEPSIEGVAGLRPWKHIASVFCYKSKALVAISDCINGFNANRIFLSYSSQGHVPMNSLVEELSKNAVVTVHELGEIGRYRPNKTAAQTGTNVSEYLIEIVKS